MAQAQPGRLSGFTPSFKQALRAEHLRSALPWGRFKGLNVFKGVNMAAPALSQGIRLIRLLSDSGPASLESISASCGMAKSSTLRLLETLQAEGLVARDAGTKVFSATVQLVPLGDAGFLQKLAGVLRKLCDETGETAEWWEHAAGKMVLVRREARAERELLVQARIGFQYAPPTFEAVPLLGAALFFPQRRIAWRLNDVNGKPCPLSAGEVQLRMTEAREKFYSIDTQPNANGVRRVAVALRRGHCWRGVLALAVPPWPPASNLKRNFLGRVTTRLADVFAND
jgi:DNA-binding IclR family transcriptional regulator